MVRKKIAKKMLFVFKLLVLQLLDFISLVQYLTAWCFPTLVFFLSPKIAGYKMLFFCSGSLPKPLCCTTIPSPVSKHCLVLPASLSQILLFANYWVRCLTISVLIKLLPISFDRFEGAPVCFRGCAGALFFRPQQDSNQRLYLVLPPR